MPSIFNRILIEFVPQSEQRYPTLGDWFIEGDEHWRQLTIRVTQHPDEHFQWPIAIHELAEALLCTHAGISQQDVDAWDISGPGKGDPDPGAHPKAPYFNQHMQATRFEDLMLEYLDIDEAEYEQWIAGDTP